jgi:hypothetical protein
MNDELLAGLLKQIDELQKMNHSFQQMLSKQIIV